MQEAIKKTAREVVVFPGSFWVLCSWKVCVTAEGMAVSDRLSRVVVGPLGVLVNGAYSTPEVVRSLLGDVSMVSFGTQKIRPEN